MAANFFGAVLFFIGCMLIVANCMVWVGNLRRHKAGNERRISYISLLPQFVMGLSALCFHASPRPWFAVWFPFLISLTDFALWELLFLTVHVILDRPKKRRTQGKSPSS